MRNLEEKVATPAVLTNSMQHGLLARPIGSSNSINIPKFTHF